MDNQHQLTPEELHIWQALSKGLTYKEIANDLDISVRVVQVRLKLLYKSLMVRNRAEAAIKYFKEQEQE